MPAMPTETTYSHARAHFAALCDEAVSTREPIIIHRRDAEDVALIAASELRGLMETAHLLRSPRNAERLLTALARARSEELPTETVDALRREFDLGKAQ
jgi:antitoxin YefM